MKRISPLKTQQCGQFDEFQLTKPFAHSSACEKQNNQAKQVERERPEDASLVVDAKFPHFFGMKTLQIQKLRTLKKAVKDYSVDRIFPADREGLPTEGRKPKFSDVARHQKNKTKQPTTTTSQQTTCEAIKIILKI